jgi:hypothetical protein
VRILSIVATAASAGALALVAAPAGARPSVCTAPVIRQALIAAGKMDQQAFDLGESVGVIRCGDVTADGAADALFTIASGGTAGDVRFGVLRGGTDGSAAGLALFKQGYAIGVARHNRRSFDVIQPHYRANDPNCCPSSFRIRRYTWTGTGFKKGKSRKVKHAPRRFYRP